MASASWVAESDIIIVETDVGRLCLKSRFCTRFINFSYV
jgi:hypothetical protein